MEVRNEVRNRSWGTANPDKGAADPIHWYTDGPIGTIWRFYPDIDLNKSARRPMARPRKPRVYRRRILRLSPIFLLISWDLKTILKWAKRLCPSFPLGSHLCLQPFPEQRTWKPVWQLVRDSFEYMAIKYPVQLIWYLRPLNPLALQLSLWHPRWRRSMPRAWYTWLPIEYVKIKDRIQEGCG